MEVTAKFLEMLRNGGEAGGKRYISRKSVELMTSNNLVTATYQPGQGFGLGFRIVTDLGKSGQPGSVGDYGWGGAYHSTYWVDPSEGLTVTYMTSLDHGVGDVRPTDRRRIADLGHHLRLAHRNSELGQLRQDTA